MSEPTVVQRLAEVAVEIRDKGLPAELRADVARRVLDVLGNSLAATPLEPSRTVQALAAEWGGSAQATAIGAAALGAGRRYPAATAALVNGTLAHALDFDDTHLPSVLHPSSNVVPAALAAAEAVGASGPALLDAAGFGIEVCVRLGMAGYDAELGNSVFFDRGLHATAICGAVGAAVAAAMLHGLDAAEIASAAGIACSMGAGVLEANRTGGTVKRVHCGWAAHCGTAAADLARHGLTGPPTVIEGRFGFLQAYCGDRADPYVVVDGLGVRWELPGIFFKPYPCNHFTHAGIDAALRLRARGLDPDSVEDIELGAAGPVLRTIAQPAEQKARPATGYAAAFSGPYTVAAALLGGGGLGVFHEDFTDEMARDERRRALAAKVRCVEDPLCSRIFPNQFPAVLRVLTRSGETFEERLDVNRGGPQDPLTDAELATKFRLNAVRSVSEERAGEIAACALGLQSLADVGELTDLLP
ncbi:MAG: MmgE/PrpD family protein [Streptosporangiales bacterium]|nr:MmgE/PrpD family protein [Streptosporangiales bacterium]